MCGITGIMAFNENGKKHIPLISAATYTLSKRGPDDEGLYLTDTIALGHRRLSIIDTSEKGHQPMCDKTGRFTIVFNGEIFNYNELKNELVKNKIEFKSESDTEVLLYLYILFGEKCLEKLDGEFAFAIYDKTTNKIFIARDRFGIKPLYYYIDEDKFIFASEMKAIMKFNIKKEIDHASLQTYLHLNYIPSPNTILNKVYKFPSASYAYISNPVIKIEKYYSINQNDVIAQKITYDDATEQLKKLLTHSVICRMVADVPVGTFLSGGIDSSIVTAIASQNTKNLQTFSIGFSDEKYFDETRYAQLVAKKLKCNHTVFSLKNNDLYAHLHSVMDYIDEPFADSSALAVYILSKYTRKEVKVALSGDGADELLGGYNKHTAELIARSGGLASSATQLAKPMLNLLPKSRNNKLGNKIRQLNKYAKNLNLSYKERYWQWAGFNSESEKLLLNNNILYKDRRDKIVHKIDENFNSFLLTDVSLVLENDMLVKVDRMSMANSLEIRVPFLNHSLVDFVTSLPVEYKIDKKNRKKILHDAFKGYLPNEIYTRKKQGFEVPLLKWFNTELKSMITDDLLSEQFINEQGIFKYDEIKKILNQLFSANPDDTVAKIWGLIVFQYWWKNNMNN